MSSSPAAAPVASKVSSCSSSEEEPAPPSRGSAGASHECSLASQECTGSTALSACEDKGQKRARGKRGKEVTVLQGGKVTTHVRYGTDSTVPQGGASCARTFCGAPMASTPRHMHEQRPRPRAWGAAWKAVCACSCAQALGGSHRLLVLCLAELCFFVLFSQFLSNFSIFLTFSSISFIYFPFSYFFLFSVTVFTVSFTFLHLSYFSVILIYSFHFAFFF